MWCCKRRDSGKQTFILLSLSSMDLSSLVWRIPQTWIQNFVHFPFQNLKLLLLCVLTDLEPKIPSSLELFGQSWFMGSLLLFLCVHSLYFPWNPPVKPVTALLLCLPVIKIYKARLCAPGLGDNLLLFGTPNVFLWDGENPKYPLLIPWG